jgi:hypothetical protein
MSTSVLGSPVVRLRAGATRNTRMRIRLSLWILCQALAIDTSAADPGALPANLRDTGFQDEAMRAALIEFTPQYPLWSDGATKRRWLYLPPGTFIDATKPDAWEFPRGTRLWKEFSHGTAIETRYIERGADGGWRYASYVWNEQGTEATLADVDGVRNLPAKHAPGGRYTVPAANDCRACHEAAPVPVLGFSALQLSADRDALAPHRERGPHTDLGVLRARGLLRNLPTELVAKPPRVSAASSTERAALGYLHGNCGHCHNDDGPLAVLELNLAWRFGAAPGAVQRALVGVPSQSRIAGLPAGAPRITPGQADISVLMRRMGSRDPLRQMPPLGSELVDAEALALVAEWIETLSH